ncbi:hypothetical protein R3P38DRAFT_151335 [Favolaschia claudopus]|uniref:Secreted protein n=1 Tax=Favolaschia claudopus TaxID=2862362 RepID=A0AAV9ZV47_9AGAR
MPPAPLIASPCILIMSVHVSCIYCTHASFYPSYCLSLRSSFPTVPDTARRVCDMSHVTGDVPTIIVPRSRPAVLTILTLFATRWLPMNYSSWASRQSRLSIRPRVPMSSNSLL